MLYFYIGDFSFELSKKMIPKIIKARSPLEELKTNNSEEVKNVIS